MSYIVGLQKSGPETSASKRMETQALPKVSSA